MFAVVASLFVVAAVALLAGGWGIVAGLSSDVSAGVAGRPLIYWMIAVAYMFIGTLFWPTLISWYIHLDLPAWHRRALVPWPQDKGRFEDIRSSRSVITLARSVEPRRRSALARAVLGYGLFYVVLSVPIPLMFGVAAMRPDSMLRPEEALPLIAAVWLPALSTAALAMRSSRRPG